MDKELPSHYLGDGDAEDAWLSTPLDMGVGALDTRDAAIDHLSYGGSSLPGGLPDFDLDLYSALPNPLYGELELIKDSFAEDPDVDGDAAASAASDHQSHASRTSASGVVKDMPIRVTKTKEIHHGQPIEPRVDDFRHFTDILPENVNKIRLLLTGHGDTRVFSQLLDGVEALTQIFSDRGMKFRLFRPKVELGSLHLEYDRHQGSRRGIVSGRLPTLMIPLGELNANFKIPTRPVADSNGNPRLGCLYCDEHFKDKSTLNRHFSNLHGVWDPIVLMGDSLLPRSDKSKFTAHQQSHDGKPHDIGNCQMITQGIFVAFLLMQIPCDVYIKAQNMLMIARLIFDPARGPSAHGHLVGTAERCLKKLEKRREGLEQHLQSATQAQPEAAAISTMAPAAAPAVAPSAARAVNPSRAVRAASQDIDAPSKQLGRPSKRLKKSPVHEAPSRKVSFDTEADEEVDVDFPTVGGYVSELTSLLPLLAKRAQLEVERLDLEMSDALRLVATSILPRSLQHRLVAVTHRAQRAVTGRATRSNEPTAVYQELRRLLIELIDVANGIESGRPATEEPTTAVGLDTAPPVIIERRSGPSSGASSGAFDISASLEAFDDEDFGGLIQQ